MPPDVGTYTARPRKTHIIGPYNEKDIPMGELKFDCDKVRIRATVRWDDTGHYNGVSKSINACISDAIEIAVSLPTDTINAGWKTDSNGMSVLRKTLDRAIKLFAGVARRIAGGCATLGSGVRSGIENFDSQEDSSATCFDILQSSPPKKWWLSQCMHIDVS